MCSVTSWCYCRCSIGGSIAAIAAFASSEPESVTSVLSKMGEKDKQHMASAAKLHMNAILWKRDNPAEARSFLMAVLKRLNFEVHVKQYRGR